MTTTLISLLIISIVALAGPLVAGLIPGKPVPEVVFLIILGAVLGPNMLGVLQITEGVRTVGQLGSAFLFLIAGYEVNQNDLLGGLGKTAAIAWVGCFALGFVLIALLVEGQPTSLHDLALTIVLTTTAYGTLAPILRERSITGTPVGRAIVAHGVAGELFPILAIAILLTTRARWESALIVVAFFVVAVSMAVIPARARNVGSRMYGVVERVRETNTNSQTLVRAVLVLLFALVVFSAVFGLDVVLGAFAAGGALRYIIPDGNVLLEQKIQALGFGFLIPAFFVVSGAGINLPAVVGNPVILLGSVAIILVVRGLPVFLSTFVSAETRAFTMMQRVEVTLYSAMALPLVVAVCEVAVAGGFMTEETSSVLVTAGAVTVLIIPVLASLTRQISAAHPLSELHDLLLYPAHREQIRSLYHESRLSARERLRSVARDGESDEMDRFDESGRLQGEFELRRSELIESLVRSKK
ncbi:MAG: cation:proton antiporter [Coriobacteriia bacterium]|nr:cation:proton antiporter [Coriobacteriia bacterium]